MLAEITYLDFLTIKFFFPIILCLILGIVLYIVCAAKDFEVGKFLVLFGTIAAVSYFLISQLFPNAKSLPVYFAVLVPLAVLLFLYIPAKVRRRRRKKEKEEKELQKHLEKERRQAREEDAGA